MAIPEGLGLKAVTRHLQTNTFLTMDDLTLSEPPLNHLRGYLFMVHHPSDETEWEPRRFDRDQICTKQRVPLTGNATFNSEESEGLVATFVVPITTESHHVQCALQAV